MLRILIKYPIFCQFNNKRQRRIFKIGITYSFLGVIYLHREAYRRNIRIGRQNYGQVFCTQCGERLGRIILRDYKYLFLVIYVNAELRLFIGQKKAILIQQKIII